MAVQVLCQRGSKDREAPSINNSLIATENQAAKRGKRFLDDPDQGSYYKVIRRTFKIPHKDNNIFPGTWITVTSQKLGLANVQLRVKSYNITITPTAVWGTLETEQFVEPSS